MRRRSFVKACALGAGAAAFGPVLGTGSDLRPRYYERVRLMDGRGQPLRVSDIQPRRNYVFHYPFASTPVFLLDLGRPVRGRNGLQTEGGNRYDWDGGVGPDRSLVAFSAICAHKLAHPTPAVSYIRFRDPRAADDPPTGVISCCAENSMYDPYRGAQVLSGPAQQPLAAILLDYHEEEGTLDAVGTLGGELFDRFFREFEERLAVEYAEADPAERIVDETDVVPLESFSGNIMRC